jgi:hypothetical protein
MPNFQVLENQSYNKMTNWKLVIKHPKQQRMIMQLLMSGQLPQIPLLGTRLININKMIYT